MFYFYFYTTIIYLYRKYGYVEKKIIDNMSEPESVYSNANLQHTEDKEIIISSLEEQEEANYLYWLSLSPVQRLELHFKMITTIYKDALMKKNRNDKKTIIDHE